MGSPGQLVVKRYRLVRALGQGNTGIVWEGHDDLLDRPVAVREVLLPAGLRESRLTALQQRIARESRQAERLRHPGIASVFDVAEEDDTLYVVMELARSRSLDGIVASDGPLEVPKAAYVIRTALAALTVAHAAGVRHGDVRPANILVGHDGRVVLADFGVGSVAADPVFAKRVGERSPAHGESWSSARSAAAFRAPERIDPDAPVRETADLWSLGASLYFAVTGKPPALPQEKPRTPAKDVDVSAAPEELRPVLAALLARDPKRRPSHEAADELLAAFEPPSAPPAPKPVRGGTRMRFIAVGAAVVVIAGAVSGWALLRPDSTVITTRTAATDPTTAPVVLPSPSPSPVDTLRFRLVPYDSPAGWHAMAPRTWKRTVGEYAVWWVDPRKRGHLSIEVTNQVGTDPLAALHEAEAILYPNVEAYRKLRLKTVGSKLGSAADWEFTWRQVRNARDTHLVKGQTYHQYRRVISTETTTTVLTWTTTAAEWDRMRPTLLRVFRAYSPTQT
ncbi:protein kinase [Herbidospora sp. NEAU-GS84]|uniref:non-specific serine/threonine protein kinase n=1 Tax=Herbidospora solisilvae TaxID=2696284 RepID=A0A7C9J394_9ACTN|nr:serine/threonine-protein kinase [Herbidospora solisilvae]NAS23447.1 protein kinase [Herbidospora solisilvae]